MSATLAIAAVTHALRICYVVGLYSYDRKVEIKIGIQMMFSVLCGLSNCTKTRTDGH